MLTYQDAACDAHPRTEISFKLQLVEGMEDTPNFGSCWKSNPYAKHLKLVDPATQLKPDGTQSNKLESEYLNFTILCREKLLFFCFFLPLNS